MANTLVIIPTYNEVGNLERLVGDILALKLSIDILVIDDNSPDGTGDLADALAHKHKEFAVIHRSGRQGIGSALLQGLREACRRGYELALTMDADYSHHPRHIPALLKQAKECEVVIGSRYISGGKWLGAPATRKLFSLAANFTTRLLLGVSARDASGGYRLYHTSILKRVNLEDIYSTGYSFEEEMLLRVQLAGARLGEVPIVFRSRTQGESKLSLWEMLSGGFQLVRLLFLRQERAPDAARASRPTRA